MSPPDEKRTPSVLSVDEKPASPAEGTVTPASFAEVHTGTVYDDPLLAKYFVPIAAYEGAHRFDIHATWTEDEERKVVRKVDFRIMLWCCIMFFALQLDRGNLTFALTDNMLANLGLTTNDYNNGNMIFYLSFLCAEIPSQLISKRLGPDRWLPMQMCLWSVVAASQCRLNGRASFFATRSLLGILEGGFIPDIVLFLSYFYKGKELPVRLSFFWTAMYLTTITSAFLAYGILHLRGVHGWAGWQYLFLIEGIITGTIGVFSFLMLPASPTQTASWFRGKNGWFTEREEIIMVNRILRDDPTKGDMHNRQPMTLEAIWLCLADYHSWPIYMIGLTVFIPQTPPTQYLTLTLTNLGFGTFNSNLLTIPSNVLFIICLLVLTQISRIANERSLVASIGNWWSIPLLIALILLPDDTNPWNRFTLLTLLLGYPYCHAILVSWASWTSGSVRLRTVSAALYNVCVQAGNVISSHIYLPSDGPYYRRGNKILLAIAIWNVFFFVAMKFWFMYINNRRSKIWDAMTSEQKAEYLATTKDKGNKRLDFRFVH